jgi:enoyl-CoA hydratase/carnithine racemase
VSGWAQLVPKHFGWAVADRVATITLNRPEKKNPLTFESYAELRDTFRVLVDASDIRAVVIAGDGGNFCSGGDVNEIIGPLVQMELPQLMQFTQMTGDVVKAIRACPQPVIAAVDGVCAGAGACLAMAADLRLGTSRSAVTFLFTRVGLAGCDMGACAMLPRLIGQGRASELLFTGRAMSAEEAFAWGFYNRIVAPESLLGEAQKLASSLAYGPTGAHAITKRMLNLEWDMGLDAAIDAEAKAQAELMTKKDFARAYRAFVARERPKFEGD